MATHAFQQHFAILPASKLTSNASLTQEFIKTDADRPRIPHNLFTHDIPVISLAHLLHPQKRQQTISDIMQASREWGLFQVLHHGISPLLLANMVDLISLFFALPLEEKVKSMASSELDGGSGKPRGYSHGSFVKGDPVADWREILIAVCTPSTSRNEHEWPSQPPHFKETLSTYAHETFKLQELLISAIAEGLGIEGNAISKASGDVEQRVLINYYPSCPQPDLTLGLRRHTDLGTITILYQDQVGGLQVTKDGGDNWVTVKPLQDAFVVNIGDFLSILSNNQLKSADHQAVVNSSSTRITIASFFNPSPDAMVQPLVGDHQPNNFNPCSFLDYYKSKIPSTKNKSN